MGSEKNFENRIKKFLKNEGIWFVKYFANGFTRSGVPDILACVNGYFVAIEVKAENGVVAPLQLFNRDKIRESGGIAVILYPNQFEDFKTLVYKLKTDSINKYQLDQMRFDKK